jgi:hypothetical protein
MNEELTILVETVAEQMLVIWHHLDSMEDTII